MSQAFEITITFSDHTGDTTRIDLTDSGDLHLETFSSNVRINYYQAHIVNLVRAVLLVNQVRDAALSYIPYLKPIDR